MFPFRSSPSIIDTACAHHPSSCGVSFFLSFFFLSIWNFLSCSSGISCSLNRDNLSPSLPLSSHYSHCAVNWQWCPKQVTVLLSSSGEGIALGAWHRKTVFAHYRLTFFFLFFPTAAYHCCLCSASASQGPWSAVTSWFLGKSGGRKPSPGFVWTSVLFKGPLLKCSRDEFRCVAELSLQLPTYFWAERGSTG